MGLTPEQIYAISLSKQFGKTLQEEFPEIAQAYLAGQSTGAIAERFQLEVIYDTSPAIIQTAIYLALAGLDDEDGYAGLLPEEKYAKARERIKKEHGSRLGNYNLETGIGIFKGDKKDQILMARKAGKKAYANPTIKENMQLWRILRWGESHQWSDAERNRLAELLHDPSYKHFKKPHLGKPDYSKIAQVLNDQFHNGENTRTPKALHEQRTSIFKKATDK